VFGRFSGKDGRQMVLDEIRRNTSTQTKINEVRRLWDNLMWIYTFEGDV